jgi:hypothetical protein
MRNLLASIIVGVAVFQFTLHRSSQSSLMAENTKAATPAKKDKPKLTISKETTYVTGPLDKDGDVDYAAALTELLGKGVTPENNANVLLIRAVGPKFGPLNMTDEYCKRLGIEKDEYYKRLGIEKLPERGDYFVDLHDYLKNNVKLEPAKLQKKEAELDLALIRPWTVDSQPEAAAWLKSNEKPLALIIEASTPSRYFWPFVSREADFYTADCPQYELSFNYDRATRKGVSIKKALDGLSFIISGTYEQGFIRFNRFYKGFYQATPDFRRPIEDLENFYIKNDRGEMVAYTAFTEIKKTPGLKEIAKALVIRAMLRLGEKRWNDAWRDLLACHRLGRVVGRSPTLRDNLAAIAIDGIASRGELVFIDRADIDAQQFLKCIADLRALPPLPNIANSIEHRERFYLLEMATKVRKDGFPHLLQLYLLDEDRYDLALDKRSIDLEAGPETQGLLNDVNWNPIFRECNRSVDELVAVLREKDRIKREKLLLRLHEKQKANEDTTKAYDLLPLLKTMKSDEKTKLLLRSFNTRVKSVHAIQLAADRSEQIQRNLQIAFALAAYRRAEGKYPKTLDQLAPKYLTQIPNDYFTDKPISYEPTKKGYLLERDGIGSDDYKLFLDYGPPGAYSSIRMPLPEPKLNR